MISTLNSVIQRQEKTSTQHSHYTEVIHHLSQITFPSTQHSQYTEVIHHLSPITFPNYTKICLSTLNISVVLQC